MSAVLDHISAATGSEAPHEGRFDGVTLLRFSHACRGASSGGIESYLDALNGQMLDRHRLRIIQTHLLENEKQQDPGIQVEARGRGEIVWVPLPWRAASIRDFGPLRWAGRALRRRARLLAVDHRNLKSILTRYRPSLAVFHWFSEDSAALVQHLCDVGVPLAAMHHFDNAMLGRPLFAQQMKHMRGVGVLTRRGLPSSWEAQARVLADAVDTDYFDPALTPSLTPHAGTGAFVVLLAARMSELKGHLEALRILQGLRGNGTNARLVFAGREEDATFARRVRKSTTALGLEQHVAFAGELLRDGLRQAYEASDVVILPSTHPEGLPRVLLEAQSMQRPVIAYDVGGCADAMSTGNSGWLVPRGQHEEMQRLLQLLAANPAMGRTMGRNGRDWVLERFGPTKLLARHERFYADVLGATDSTGRP